MTVQFEDLVSIPQAMGLLGVSYSTIRRHIRNGQLAAHRDGVRWWIERATVERLRETQQFRTWTRPDTQQASPCPECGRSIRAAAGMASHRRAAHGMAVAS